MAEEFQRVTCEEPDADFFDTFFDDGVLETIGQVLSGSENEDSSCSKSVTESSLSLMKKPQPKESIVSSTKVTNSNPLCHNPGNKSELYQNRTKATNCVIDFDFNEITPSSEVASNTKRTPGEPHSSSDKPLPEEKSRNSEKPTNLSLDELLAKVKVCLQNTPQLKSATEKSPKGNQDSSIKNSNNQERKKKDILAIVNKCLGNPCTIDVCPNEKLKTISTSRRISRKKESILPSTSHISKNPAVKPVIDVGISFAKQSKNDEIEDGELCDDPLPISSQELTSKEASPANSETKATQDDTEKENDLLLEGTCSKTGGPVPVIAKKNTIQLNLKTQILASTTILNADSPSAIHSRSKEKSKAYDSGKSSRYVNEPKRDNDKPKRRRDRETESLAHDKTSKWKSRESSNKDKKKKKKDSSPSFQGRTNKESRSKYRRSRSRSTTPPQMYRRQQQYEKSPDRFLYQKPRRAISRSPSNSPPRSYRRRYFRSPVQSRSRSRSRSLSLSPHRVWNSPSPSTHHSKSSRSRSKSPFINEINRLKKMWEKEDNAKKNGQLSHPTWVTETNSSSTSYVSNMVSVQVHSTFAVGDSVDAFSNAPYQGVLPAGEIPMMKPHIPNALTGSLLQPEFNRFREGGGFPVPSTAFPNLPEIPGLGPPVTTEMSNFHQGNMPSMSYVPGNGTHHPASVPFCIPPPLSHFPLPPPPLHVPSETILPVVQEPQTSNLRKQLDILMSSVVSQPAFLPIAPRKCQTNHRNSNSPSTSDRSLVNITCEPPVSTASCDGQSSSNANHPIKLSCEPSSTVSDLQTSANANQPSSGDAPSSPNDNEVHVRKQESPKPACDAESLLPTIACEQSAFEDIDKTNLAENKSSGAADIPAVETKSVSEIVPEEEDDPDIIIEELPPKPPPELICLSDDDTEEIYNLGVELDKIHQDIALKEQDVLKEQEIPIVEISPRKSSPKEKKRKRKEHEKNAEETMQDGVGSQKRKKRKRHSKKRKAEEKEKELHKGNTVLRECREMIDTLRIGRFVVNSDDDIPAELPNSGNSNSPNSSVLCRTERTEFSYSKNTQPEEIPRVRNKSTNTPLPLCVEVFTSTESTQLRDSMNQTDLECLGCNEKRALIKNLSTELLKMKKERDDLLALVLDIGGSCPIPGLDSSAEERKALRFSMTESPTPNLAVGDERLGVKKPGQILKQTPIEPVLAYDYNHSSPERCRSTNFFS